MDIERAEVYVEEKNVYQTNVLSLHFVWFPKEMVLLPYYTGCECCTLLLKGGVQQI